jgi:hypothetical protein
VIVVGFVATLAILQGILMLVDELYFHRRRGLPRWERLGHPLDTSTVTACYAWLLAASPGRTTAMVFAVLALFSCVFVTKDEPLHAKHCSPGEHWLHAMLFWMHPVVLAGVGWLWWQHRARPLVVVQLVATAAFGVYQLAYWSTRSWRRA